MAQSKEAIYVSYKLVVGGLFTVLILVLVMRAILVNSWLQPTQSQSGLLGDLSTITQTIIGGLLGLLGGKATR
jgi:hypothetical protein